MKRALLVVALVAGAAQAQPGSGHLELPQQNLMDGQKVQLSPLSLPETRAARDRRPMVIGGGIVVLAAIFWWNRKRRERFDASDRPTDRDSDDLQAAARGAHDDHKDDA